MEVVGLAGSTEVFGDQCANAELTFEDTKASLRLEESDDDVKGQRV